MKQHAVFYRQDPDAMFQVFMCQAEDREHAIEQFNNACPEDEDFHEFVMVDTAEA